MATLNFHVRHEVQPKRVWQILDAMINGLDYDHVTQFDRQLSRMRQLGLISGRGQFEITEDGRELHRIGTRRQDVGWDLLHFLHYTQWRSSNATENTIFYTYQTYCNLLYSKGTLDIAASREALALEMTNIISTSSYFADEISNLAKGAVSLSANSLNGVEHWLDKLAPEVISNDGQFARRHYCSPELLLMTLGYITNLTGAELGLEQPLTPDRREILCRVCLITDEVLDQMLDWLLPEYPHIVQQGTTTGNYGRFIRLLELPTLKDLLQ